MPENQKYLFEQFKKEEWQKEIQNLKKELSHIKRKVNDIHKLLKTS